MQSLRDALWHTGIAYVAANLNHKKKYDNLEKAMWEKQTYSWTPYQDKSQMLLVHRTIQ